MRAFWAMVIGLVLVAAGVLAWDVTRSERMEPADAAVATSEPRGQDAAQIQPHEKPQDEQLLTARTTSVEGNGTPRLSPDPARGHTHSSTAGAKPVSPPENARKRPGESDKSAGDTPPLVPPTHAPSKIDEWDVMAAKSVEELEGGGLRVEGRFTLRGGGTKNDPIRIPWELLVSAEEVFDPSRNLRRIPESVALLHGKYVALEGYVLFPLQTVQPRELLIMMNTWDGCCIGVPPTPYDAVEVRLTGTLRNDDRFAISGTVVGKFSVKPYVVKNWLVGIYVIDDATFEAGVDDEGLGT